MNVRLEVDEDARVMEGLTVRKALLAAPFRLRDMMDFNTNLAGYRRASSKAREKMNTTCIYMSPWSAASVPNDSNDSILAVSQKSEYETRRERV